jgi:SAM-dependent methyltransferase/uncharacterized protein YbaR (Trm112 family)
MGLPNGGLRRVGRADAGVVARSGGGGVERVLLRADMECAYPVVEGVPILLAPEMLSGRERCAQVDVNDVKYAEAYAEMAFYSNAAMQEATHIKSSESYVGLEPCLRATDADRASFPDPLALWLRDAPYDCAAQWDAYRHLAPLAGKRVLQLGGKGAHAVKFLLAGAREAWNLSPMPSEALCALALAREFGVVGHLRCVVGVAEELPFPSDFFDAVFSGGCIHHTTTGIALPEIARVLGAGGRFAAADPWRAPLYAIGTRLLGKREPNPFCRPLDRERVAPLRDAFAESSVIQHGTLTRYPLLALQKFGIQTPLSLVWRLNRIDDAICSLLPSLRRAGSGVALLGSKGGVSSPSRREARHVDAGRTGMAPELAADGQGIEPAEE